MTNKQHPITPPFELMNQWYKKACKDPYNGGKFIMAPVLKDISNSAAQWGADQELNACEQWVEANFGQIPTHNLHQFRRPKPPSLKEQALEELDELLAAVKQLGIFNPPKNIRRALEALPND